MPELPEELIETADKLANYLHIVLAIEYDIDLIDRVAKARRLDDFLEAIYNALRRKFTIERKIGDLLSKVEDEQKEYLNRALGYIRSFNPSDVEILRNKLASRPLSIKETASYIGSKSIASTVLFDNLRKLTER
ncbi:hypothetical protein KEJ27_08870 [Candidatus Bathyarchaeota archaeon]|nr:hypothetical protein [Candidatus Bathyarchaeota archaeon]MBS7618158.1 hypothetical protein [Candidatus Bathyarchaeota archaeon]